MTGWLLIISLLVLGGLLATLGDLLGSRIGKARLSIFKLRPKKTAIFITVLTGSLISAISLGLMLLVSRQLRVGLFELNDIQTRLSESRKALLPLQKERILLEQRIINGEEELKQLESNLIALRRGDVVISSGQSLATMIINSQDSNQIKEEIQNLLQRANLYSYLKIRPGDNPDKRILLIKRNHIEKLEEFLSKEGSWVVNIKSAGNVLLGENYIYAYPEVILNRKIVNLDEVISSIDLNINNIKSNDINDNMQILISSTLAEVKRRGSISSELQINANDINNIAKNILNKKISEVKINAVSLRESYTADPVSIRLQIEEINSRTK